jgi:hypothetical protein
MAVVFRALDGKLGRRVALKILAPALAADAAFRQRFIRESRAAAAIDDPHIIPLFEAGESDGVLFIAMRYVRAVASACCWPKRARSTRTASRGSWRRWPRRWTPRTRPAWFTATSSRPTCCLTRGQDGPITCTCQISA